MQAVFRVFDGEAIRGWQFEAGEDPVVDVGGGFLVGDAVAGTDDFEPVGRVRAQAGAQEGGDVFRRGRGGDGEAQAGAAGGGDQFGDAGAQRQLAGGDALQVMRGLGGVQLLDQGGEIGARGAGRIVALGVVADAFLAAGDGEQFAVQFFIPVPVQAAVGEGGVEGGAMAVALGFGERAVDIEDQGVQAVHAGDDSARRVGGASQDC